jgi:hypothetical protein
MTEKKPLPEPKPEVRQSVAQRLVGGIRRITRMSVDKLEAVLSRASRPL